MDRRGGVTYKAINLVTRCQGRWEIVVYKAGRKGVVDTENLPKFPELGVMGKRGCFESFN